MYTGPDRIFPFPHRKSQKGLHMYLKHDLETVLVKNAKEENLSPSCTHRFWLPGISGTFAIPRMWHMYELSTVPDYVYGTLASNACSLRVSWNRHYFSTTSTQDWNKLALECQGLVQEFDSSPSSQTWAVT